jgi:O-antigen/teichoic acid export membrane protein
MVVRMLGPATLAQYSIGRVGEPIVTTLRSSLSAVVQPEMVRQSREAAWDGPERARQNVIALWQRATVVNLIILLPVVVLLARYARPVVTTVFGPNYAQAAPLVQLYMLVVIRECFDFAPALRAINRTRPLVESNVAALITCAAALWVLIPMAGAPGAMMALVLTCLVDAGWLAHSMGKLYGAGFGTLFPLRSMGRTVAAALASATLVVSSAWTDAFGIFGVVLASAAYVAAFALLLLALRVPEAFLLLAWAKRLLPAPAAISRKV